MRSLFDDSDGYYAAYLNDFEVSRHAPSQYWSRYADEMQAKFGDQFSHRFVIKE